MRPLASCPCPTKLVLAIGVLALLVNAQPDLPNRIQLFVEQLSASYHATSFWPSVSFASLPPSSSDHVILLRAYLLVLFHHLRPFHDLRQGRCNNDQIRLMRDLYSDAIANFLIDLDQGLFVEVATHCDALRHALLSGDPPASEAAAFLTGLVRRMGAASAMLGVARALAIGPPTGTATDSDTDMPVAVELLLESRAILLGDDVLARRAKRATRRVRSAIGRRDRRVFQDIMFLVSVAYRDRGVTKMEREAEAAEQLEGLLEVPWLVRRCRRSDLISMLAADLAQSAEVAYHLNTEIRHELLAWVGLTRVVHDAIEIETRKAAPTSLFCFSAVSPQTTLHQVREILRGRQRNLARIVLPPVQPIWL
jgi:hypothetical protein